MITIEVDDQSVSETLERLRQRATDATPVMRAIAMTLLSATEENFANQRGPLGPWPALKASTLKRRPGGRGKILQDSGRLAASITPAFDATSAVIGTNVVYATTHQFGATRGAFGQGKFKTRQGRFPIPWGNIPARPFLPVTATGQLQAGVGTEVIEAINLYLTEK